VAVLPLKFCPSVLHSCITEGDCVFIYKTLSSCINFAMIHLPVNPSFSENFPVFLPEIESALSLLPSLNLAIDCPPPQTTAASVSFRMIDKNGKDSEVPLGSGQFGDAFIVELQDELKSRAVLKLNRLAPGDNYAFVPMSRDIAGMKMVEESMVAYKWMVKYLSTFIEDDGSLFLTVNSNIYVQPGIIMEFVDVYEPFGTDTETHLCKYLLVLAAIRDLLQDQLIHEDLHSGNAVIVNNEFRFITWDEDGGKNIIVSEVISEEEAAAKAETFGGSCLVCRNIRLIDTGSVNSLDGSAAEPFFNSSELISRKDRLAAPNEFFCKYLAAMHTKSFTADYYGKGSELIGKLLDELLQGKDCEAVLGLLDEGINKAFVAAVERSESIVAS